MEKKHQSHQHVNPDTPEHSDTEMIKDMISEDIPVDRLSDIMEEMLDEDNVTLLRNMLLDLHSADIADALHRLDRDDREMIFSFLDSESAGDVLLELDDPVLHEVLDFLDEERLVEIIGLMESDDATDIVGELEEERAHRVLGAMPWKEFREVKALLSHDEETAGGIMALEIVSVFQNRTAQEALEELRKKADEVEDVFNIYVVDRFGVLKGLVSLKDLALAPPKARLTDIMEPEVISIHPKMDQEEVYNIFRKYDLVVAPVVDEKDRLVGRITVDDVLEVVEEEVNEDITLMAGITDENIRERSLFRLSGVRLPWLLVAFVGELISAYVMSRFQHSIGQVLMAAFFIPLIMAMGGNTGIQSATVVIRGLATGEFSLRDTGQRLFHELSVALLNGMVIAILLFFVSLFWFKMPRFGLVLGISMIAVLFNAALMGTLVPFLLKRLNIDPAVATGPFITTSNDVLGLMVYFGLITAFMSWLNV